MNRLTFLAAGMFTIGCDHYIVACLLPGISASLGSSIVAVSQGVTAFAAVLAVLLAKQPARLVLFAALTVFLLGNLLTILAPSLSGYLLGRAISGVGAGLFTPLAVATGTHLVAPEKRGRALGILWGCNSAGAVLGGPAALWLSSHYDWRASFCLIMGIAMLAMVGVVILPPVPQVQAPPSLQERLRRLSNRRVLGVIFVTFATTAASLGLFTFAAPLSEGAAAPVGQALWCWSIGGLLGSYGIGSVVDRTGQPRVVMAGVLGALLLAILSVPMLRSVPLLCLIPFVAWGMASWSTVTPQQLALIGFEPEHRAAVVSMNSTAVSLGGVLGSASFALLLSNGLAAPSLPFAAAFVLLGVSALQLALIRKEARAVIT